MRLEDSYRLLEIGAGATDEEVKRAWRDLSKVWHPDRFASDPFMRSKAEEKVKAINEAYETIRVARGDQPVSRKPRSYFSWAVGAGLAGLFILARRPTPAGLIIAGVLFCVAVGLLVRMSRVRQ